MLRKILKSLLSEKSSQRHRYSSSDFKKESMDINIPRNMAITTIRENIDQAVSSAPTVANEGALF